MPDDPTTEPLPLVAEAELNSPPVPTLPRTFGWPATFRSLRHPNYRLYFFGQIVSLTGTWMQTTAVTWLAYQITQQSKWPAMIGAASLLPTFLLGAWAGNLADRWPKRSLLCVTQILLLLLAALLALLVYVGEVVPWQLLAITAASGIVVAVDLPARLAFVLDLVGGNREDLMNAVALNSVLFNAARVVGPVLGVETLYWFGPAACFSANALSYVAVVVALLLMDARGEPGPAGQQRGLRALGEGFAALARQPRLLILVIASGTTALCSWPFLNLLPALAARDLGAPERGYGLMVGCAGGGSLAAALTIATFGTWSRRRWLIGTGVALVCAMLIGLSLANSLVVAAACCAFAGFGLILFFATSQSIVQLSAEERSRGRVLGIWAMVISGATPLGNLIVGNAADEWGVEPVLLWQGIACAASAALLLGVASFWMRRETCPAGLEARTMPE
jgi:MFS family permease